MRHCLLARSASRHHPTARRPLNRHHALKPPPFASAISKHNEVLSVTPSAPSVAAGYIDPFSNAEDWTSDDTYTRRRNNVGNSQTALPQAPTVVRTFPEHARGSVAKNGLVLLDKPLEWTAFECVKAVKFAYKAPSAGHFGSLEKNASGLVIVALGSACKLGQAFEEMPREYRGLMRLGTATDTNDSTGKVTEQLPWKQVTDKQLQEAAKQFCGEIMQVPPMTSGFIVGSKPLYKYARKGEVPDVQARPSYVHQLTVWRDNPDSTDVRFKLTCARGVYIRPIVDELARVVGSCAHLVSLRRHAIGDFNVEDAWTLDTLIPLIQKYAKAYRSG